MSSAESPPLSPSGQLRLDIVMREVGRIAPTSILEVGPGLGAISVRLAQIAPLYRGYEMDCEAAHVAQRRLHSFPDAEVFAQALPAKPNHEFDALVALEVLEHIEDDGILASWVKWLRPGGHALLSVPAKEDRFGPYDEAVGHYRRYEKPALLALMADSGLRDVSVYAYGMPLGYLLEGIRNRMLVKRLAPEADKSERTARSGRAFQPDRNSVSRDAVLWPSVRLQRWFENTEWGIGWVAIGRRAKDV